MRRRGPAHPGTDGDGADPAGDPGGGGDVLGAPVPGPADVAMGDRRAGVKGCPDDAAPRDPLAELEACDGAATGDPLAELEA